MKKKYLILALIVLILPVAGLAAQDSYSILSLDIGFGPSYNFNGNSVGTLSTFGLNVRVAGPLSVGFITGTYSMLKVKFDVTSAVRAVIGYGSGNSVALGFEVVPFKRSVSGLFTEFKIAPEYFWTGAAIENGTLAFSLLLGVGF